MEYLPDEVIMRVMAFLNPYDILALGLTCKNYSLWLDYEDTWKIHLLSQTPAVAVFLNDQLLERYTYRELCMMIHSRNHALFPNVRSPQVKVTQYGLVCDIHNIYETCTVNMLPYEGAEVEFYVERLRHQLAAPISLVGIGISAFREQISARFIGNSSSGALYNNGSIGMRDELVHLPLPNMKFGLEDRIRVRYFKGMSSLGFSINQCNNVSPYQGIPKQEFKFCVTAIAIKNARFVVNPFPDVEDDE